MNTQDRIAETVRAEFYLHNAVVQRDFLIPMAHAEALEMDMLFYASPIAPEDQYFDIHAAARQASGEI